MDPVSRRFMWNYISTTMQGRAVILTTHSMEEVSSRSSSVMYNVRFSVTLLSTTQPSLASPFPFIPYFQAEALCQRIGIMVNGRLACLGSR
jgi:hypothetical protein